MTKEPKTGLGLFTILFHHLLVKDPKWSFTDELGGHAMTINYDDIIVCKSMVHGVGIDLKIPIPGHADRVTSLKVDYYTINQMVEMLTKLKDNLITNSFDKAFAVAPELAAYIKFNKGQVTIDLNRERFTLEKFQEIKKAYALSTETCKFSMLYNNIPVDSDILNEISEYIAATNIKIASIN